MRIKIEQATTVQIGDEMHRAGDVIDVEPSIGEALVQGKSAQAVIGDREDALKV